VLKQAAASAKMTLCIIASFDVVILRP
jgi:hypothetical protein